MLQKIILITSIALFLLLGTVGVHAICSTDGSIQDMLAGCASSDKGDQVAIHPNAALGTGVDGVKRFVIQVAEGALGFAALFAIGAIVLSGIRYTTSQGDDEKLKNAKNTAVYALIGLVLALLAFPLVEVVVNFIYGLGN